MKKSTNENKYQAGTFAEMKPFATIKKAREYATAIKKVVTSEVRIVRPDGRNIIL